MSWMACTLLPPVYLFCLEKIVPVIAREGHENRTCTLNTRTCTLSNKQHQSTKTGTHNSFYWFPIFLCCSFCPNGFWKQLNGKSVPGKKRGRNEFRTWWKVYFQTSKWHLIQFWNTLIKVLLLVVSVFSISWKAVLASAYGLWGQDKTGLECSGVSRCWGGD